MVPQKMEAKARCVAKNQGQVWKEMEADKCFVLPPHSDTLGAVLKSRQSVGCCTGAEILPAIIFYQHESIKGIKRVGRGLKSIKSGAIKGIKELLIRRGGAQSIRHWWGLKEGWVWLRHGR